MLRVLKLLMALFTISMHAKTLAAQKLPIIIMQPTDLNNVTQSNFTITQLATQEFEISMNSELENNLLKIPCQATAYPESVNYSWFKWNKTSKLWLALENKEQSITWSTEVNGDLNEFGMLTIHKYGKDYNDNDGAYMCGAKTKYGIAVSKVLNLTTVLTEEAANSQHVVTTHSLPAGGYARLDVPENTTTPSQIPIWTLKNTTQNISHQHTQIDEKGSLHLGYVDTALLQNGAYVLSYYNLRDKSIKIKRIYALSVEGNFLPGNESCTLKYQTPSLSLVHGQSSRLVCVYAGSPSITVSYFKHDASGKPQQLTPVVADGEALLQTGLYGNTYMISSAQTTDAGTYSCSATFKTSTSEQPCNDTAVPINVTVDLEPTFVLEPSPVTYVLVGQSVTLQWRVKGHPRPTIEIGQNAEPLPKAPTKIKSSTLDYLLVDPVDGMPVFLRTFTLFNAVKPNDSRSLQVYARNQYYIAVSSVALMVISPITFQTKMHDQLELPHNATGYFVCTANVDDALESTITWTRLFAGVTYSVVDGGAGGQYSIATNNASAPSGLRVLSQTLTVNSSLGGDFNDSRGYYVCNVSNGGTWNVNAARLSFVGDEPVLAWLELWMLGVLCSVVAAGFLIFGVIIAVMHNRGEPYAVEKEEIRKGFNPKKEAQELSKLHEYCGQYENELAEPLLQS